MMGKFYFYNGKKAIISPLSCLSFCFKSLEDDLIKIVTESTFSASVGQPAPRRHVDYIVDRALRELGLHSADNAWCKKHSKKPTKRPGETLTMANWPFEKLNEQLLVFRCLLQGHVPPEPAGTHLPHHGHGHI